MKSLKMYAGILVEICLRQEDDLNWKTFVIEELKEEDYRLINEVKKHCCPPGHYCQTMFVSKEIIPKIGDWLKQHGYEDEKAA